MRQKHLFCLQTFLLSKHLNIIKGYNEINIIRVRNKITLNVVIYVTIQGYEHEVSLFGLSECFICKIPMK